MLIADMLLSWQGALHADMAAGGGRDVRWEAALHCGPFLKTLQSLSIHTAIQDPWPRAHLEETR